MPLDPVYRGCTIAQAAELLRRGELVAMPTETVYGLAADATNPAAVDRIFKAKGRPSTNPLIVHIADSEIAERYAAVWPIQASQLADNFWPGPLTIVLPKTGDIAPAVTAGGPTVALRVPNHPVALRLLREFAGPVAAPSANRSNYVSPTEAEHVRAELGDAVACVLDGGRCDVGIESTVVDLSGDRPTILRPGGVTRSRIEDVIGPTDLFTGAVDAARTDFPGQSARHYSPRTRAIRFESSRRKAVLSALGDRKIAVLLFGPGEGGRQIDTPTDPAAYSHQMYATLRLLDAQALDAIYIELPPDQPEWTAVRDRLVRASETWEQE